MKEKNPLKIALTGASCTGKTTLLEACKKFYKNRNDIAFVDESARKYFETHTPPERFSSKTQIEIQNMTLENENNACKKNPAIILTDSSTVDQVVYTKALGGTEDEGEALFNRISHWIPTYSKFLMMDPNEVVFENDNVRTESLKERYRVHEIFVAVFDEKKLPYEIISGTPEERVKKVDQIITTYSSNNS